MSAPQTLRHVHALRRQSALCPTSRQRALLSTSLATAARIQPGKPVVLEKPDRFRPPSHPQRLVKGKKQHIQQYGPNLTEEQKEKMRSKKYPHMMPPDGSFMRWFITNRTIHIWISMGVLTSLGLFAFTQNFLLTTPYRDLLPPKSDLLTHPFASISQWLTVYKMHVQWNSEQVAEKRRRKLEDVERQKAYRKAHGMAAEPAFFGSLTGKDYGAEPEEEGQSSAIGEKVAALVENNASSNGRVTAQSDEVIEYEQQPKKQVKKWFGIW